ncbi:MAG: exonuclease domain-containing protein [Nanoarchaeota archaeon]
MIVLDIETSGINFSKNGIWQIGAIDLETREEFLQECRIDNDEDISSEALLITGKSEKELRNNKQSQKQMIENFLKWVENKKIHNFICQNPQFDIGFIKIKSEKYGLKIPKNHRAFDLHSIAQIIYFQLNKDFLFNYNKKGSDFNMSKILEFCGVKDNRKNHNALEDCKLTGECFSRLVYSKKRFKEYEVFEIPDYLKKGK